MGFDSAIHIPLRFYNAVEKQDRFKPHVNKTWVQYTDTTHLPEFQIQVASGCASCTVNLVSLSTGAETTVTQGSDFFFVTYTSFKYFIYARTVTLSTITEGGYYLKVTESGGTIHYSETFSVVNSLNGYTILVYYNTNDLGGIDYGTSPPFKITLALDDVTFAKPEYVIEEEGTEDGDGNVLITFQRRVKLYKMWFYAPEYIADAISLIPLHDNVTLYLNYNETDQESGQIYDFAMTAEWVETKGLAKITCEFRDQPVIKTNCADPII